MSASELFNKIMDKLADDPTKQHREWADEFWSWFLENRDASNIECDESLIALKLAKECIRCGMMVYKDETGDWEEHECD